MVRAPGAGGAQPCPLVLSRALRAHGGLVRRHGRVRGPHHQRGDRTRARPRAGSRRLRRHRVQLRQRPDCCRPVQGRQRAHPAGQVAAGQHRARLVAGTGAGAPDRDGHRNRTGWQPTPLRGLPRHGARLHAGRRAGAVVHRASHASGLRGDPAAPFEGSRGPTDRSPAPHASRLRTPQARCCSTTSSSTRARLRRPPATVRCQEVEATCAASVGADAPAQIPDTSRSAPSATQPHAPNGKRPAVSSTGPTTCCRAGPREKNAR